MLCLGVVGMAAVLQGCTSANYFAKTQVDGGKIAVKKSEFTFIDGDKTKQRKYVLVRLGQSEFPICLYKHSETEYSALLMYCTHKGCELLPQGEYLVCPCHGSEFSNKGKVLNPPAEQDLKQYATSTDDENIYIQL